MKLIRFGVLNEEKTGIAVGDILYDTSAFGEDYNERFFASDGLKRLQKFLDDKQKSLPEIQAGTRLGSPVARPSKIVCIGLNYVDHAREIGAESPKEPVIFLKSTTALAGPNDDIMIPRNSIKTDWEVELAVVIGTKANYIEEANALQYVAGYTLHNDVSEREFQMERGGTWDKGKGCDTFAPIGPYLVTKDEINDVNNLKLWLTLNGQIMQDGNTSNFIFNVAHVISYVSKFMTLLPGDIISTGTPAGVGLGMKPQVFLKPGDVIESGVDNLGNATQHVIAYSKQ